MLRLGSGPVLVSTAVAAVLLAASPALSVAPSFWRSDTYNALESGTPVGTSILHDGRIVLSPPFEKHAVADAQYVWRAAPGPGGTYTIVAGTPGRLCRVGRGDQEVLFEVETSDLPALAAAPNGDIYVGTAPGGEVHRVRQDGSEDLFFETGQGGIWSMAYSPVYGLIVGTGDSARVYAVADDGSSEVLYASRESSITALALVGDRVLAGTGTGGLLVDVTPGRDLRVLYDADVDEISGIAQGPDDEIYFAATSVALDEALSGDAESDQGYGQGYILRTTEGGGVVGLASFEDVPVTSLGPGPDGSIWAGTGGDGRIYSIGKLGTIDLVADLDAEQVLSIVPDGDRVLVTTGLEGSLFVGGPGTGDSGSFESEAMDAGSIATWGELSWRTEEPGGSKVSFSARSGNTRTPDDTWSEWSAVSGEGEGAIGCPRAQFMEWRADLRGGRGSGPIVRSVEVNYLEENLPPRLNDVTVYASSDVTTSPQEDGESVEQTLPSGVRVTYSAAPTGAPGSPTRTLGGVRTIEWDALDPNDDALVFDVWIKSEDEEGWKLLDKDIERTLHTWDTQSMPDGLYRVKVVASDRPSNPVELARSDERVSAPFVVDNTRPSVSFGTSREGKTIVVSGTATDVLSAIVRVEVAVDYADWKPAFAEDGLFDSRAESFRAVVEDPGPGEHSVTARAFDRAGNVAVSRTVGK
jgi:hypothetical protein